MFQKHRTEFLRDRRDQVKVRTRQQFDLAVREPGGDLIAVTLRAGAIPAAVKHPKRMVAVVAAEPASASHCGLAGRDVENRFFLRGKRHVPECPCPTAVREAENADSDAETGAEKDESPDEKQNENGETEK